MIQSDNAPVLYIVKKEFLLNLGEASSKQSFKVAEGDLIEFDGVDVHVRGIKGSAPSLRAALREGWLEEAPVKKATAKATKAAPAAAPAPVSKKDSKKDTGTSKLSDVIKTQASVPASKPIQSSAPTPLKVRTVTTSDDQVVSSTRAGKGSPNPESVQATTTKPTTRGNVETDEGTTIDAVRARTGAASPGKAAALGKTGAFKAPQSPVKVATRARVVTSDGDDVVIPSSRAARAATKNSAQTLDGTASVSDEYESVPTPVTKNASVESSDPAARTAGQGGRATPSSSNNTGKKQVEAQVVDSVYKGRRATPAVTNFEATAEMNPDVAPKPIRKEAELVVLRKKEASGDAVEVSKTRPSKESTSEGAISSRVSVSSNNDLSVPEAKSYNTSDPIIMSKTASVGDGAAKVTATEDSIHDPSDYLGLQGNSAVVKKEVSVIDPDAPEVPEDDFSYLNEDVVALEKALTPPPPPKVDKTAVSDDFLNKLIVEGSRWEKAKFFVKIKYINKCTNLSILGLISKDASLAPSVKKCLADRIELLSVAAPAKVKK